MPRRSPPRRELVAKGLAESFTSMLDRIVDLRTIRLVVDRFLSKHYDAGLKRQGVTYGVNFQRNEGTIAYLQDATFEHIKGITDDIRTRLESELSKALAANEDREQIRRRIADVFRGDNPTRINFEDRVELIRRTEIARAENYAALDAAKQLKIRTKKRLAITLDERTSDICRAMSRKYGDDAQAIERDEPFVVTVKVGNKTQTISEMAPPFHPNCRSGLQLVTQRGE